MLQKMRAFSKSWVSSLFLGALALSFVAWGIGDIFKIGGNDNSVVTVGSDAIPAQVFSRDYRNFLRMPQTWSALGKVRSRTSATDATIGLFRNPMLQSNTRRRSQIKVEGLNF